MKQLEKLLKNLKNNKLEVYWILMKIILIKLSNINQI